MTTLTSRAARGLACIALLSLFGCGGGGSSSHPPPPPAAPSALSYASPQAYTINTAITALTPTVTGSVTSYAIAPALPAGLSLNTASGAISGTPTALSAATGYTVTATNGSGSTNATLSIAVNDTAPAISYSPASKRMATGASYTLAPNATGGAVTSWTVTPALPAGLTLDATTGVVSGTPTAAAAQALYQVRAQNSGGQSTFDLSLTVLPGTLLELGHVGNVVKTGYAGTRVVSLDELGHWVLWNYASGALVTKGNLDCTGALGCKTRIALVGNTFASHQSFATPERPVGFELRDATTGAVIASIPVVNPFWWRLATDGSYLVFGDNTALEVWTRAGTRVFHRDGDYSRAKVFATPAQIRIALGPRGDDVIENLAAGDGSSTQTAAFAGTFRTWFEDGERFITLAGSTVTTYSRLAAQLDITPLANPANIGTLFGGAGDFFWETDNTSSTHTLYFYRVGTGTLTQSYLISSETLVPSNQFLVLLGANQVSMFDLSTNPDPVRTDYAVPGLYTLSDRAFASVGVGDWIAGTFGGRLIDGASLSTSPRYFGIGAVRSLTATSQRAVIALARGDIAVLDLATRAVEGTIPFAADRVKISPDGLRLGARGVADFTTAPPLKIYAMPARTEVFEWTYGPTAANSLGDFSWSADGSLLAQSVGNLTTASPTPTMLTRTVGPPLGGPATFTNTITFDSFDMPSLATWPWVRLAPNGADLTLSSGTEIATVGSDIYLNGSLTSAVVGSAMGWVDANRFLADRFIPNGRPGRYNGSVLYQRDGTRIRDVVFPARPLDFQNAAADAVYVPALNAIYSIDNPTDTAVLLWSSSNAAVDLGGSEPRGTLAGASVIFVSNGEVRMEPY